MFSKTLANSILACLMVISVAQHAWYWPQLPDRVATHFGADGKPNDWMSRTAATSLFLALQLGVPLFLVAVTSIANRMPDSMINIPHREYWLTGERREASLAHMSTMMAWIAVMTAAFMAAIGHLTFIANKSGTGLNTWLFVSALAAYLLGVFALAVRSLLHFRRP